MAHQVRQYEVRLSNAQWARATAARLEAGRLWTRLVMIHHYCRKHHLPWPGSAALQAHFKGRFALHSQSMQAIVQKFIANVDVTRTKRAQGDLEASYPWKHKRYGNVVWKGQGIKWEGDRIVLPMGRGREPLCIRLPAMPEGQVVQAELSFGRMIVTFKTEVETSARGQDVAAVDLGLIHLAVVTEREGLLGSGGAWAALHQAARAQGQG